MLPVIDEFVTAHQVPRRHDRGGRGRDLRGESEGVEAAGLSFILGMRIPRVPYVVG